MLGIDRARMKLFDIENSQQGLQDAGNDTPVFDNTKAGGSYEGFKF
jgi:hypothetical protein